MAPRARHDRATYALLLLVAPSAWAIAGPWFGAGVLVGTLATAAGFSPDLDLAENRKPKRLSTRLLRWYLLPYARLAKHRHVSHWPVIGTLTRVFYLMVAPTVACLLLALACGWDVPLAGNVAAVPVWLRLTFAGEVAGMMVSDVIHWLKDIVG